MEPVINDQTLGTIVDEKKIDPRKFLQIFFSALVICIAVAAIGIGLYFLLTGAFDGYDKLMEKGAASFEKGDFEQAEGYYLKALAANEDSVPARVALCQTYEMLGKYAEMETIAMQGINKRADTYEYYAFKAKAMCLQGNLEGARDFLSKVTNNHALIKLNRNSPSDISFSTAPGTYGEPIEISLSVSEGAVIYYTTDGSAPTLASDKYAEPFTLDSGTLMLRCFAMSEAGLIGKEQTANYVVRDGKAVYTFKDQAVGAYVRQILQVSSSASVTFSMMDKITVFSTLEYEVGQSIKSLEDLKELVNLEQVHISGQKNIVDYSVLSMLPGLRKLTLADCGITDARLPQVAAAVNCTELNLDANALTSVSALGSMSALTTLSVQNNKLTTVAGLETIPRLNKLYAAGNELADMAGVAGLTQLKELYIQNNDILVLNNLSGLNALTLLDISDNGLITLEGIATLPALKRLIAAGNDLVDLPSFTGITGLTWLDLSGNRINSFAPLKKITITTLVVENCNITDITDICGIGAMQELYLGGNPISDISKVISLTTLTLLDISNTNVRQVAVLSGHKTLTTIVATGCRLTDAAAMTGTKITVVQ